MSGDKTSRVVVRLGGRTVLDEAARTVSALVSIARGQRPRSIFAWLLLPLGEVLHRFQYRSWKGHRPASPIEQIRGEALAVLVLQLDGRPVGVGFREGDELELEVIRGRV